MRLKADQLPLTPRSIWEAIARIRRDILELQAARTLEASAIGDGGLTVQSATGTGRRIVIAPKGAIAVLLPSGDHWFPPGIMFYTGDPAEVTPGEMTAYLAPDETFVIPTWIATTPDMGNGISEIKLQAGVPGSIAAAMEISVGNDDIILGNGVAEFDFEDGTVITLSRAGAQYASEGPIALTLNNGWTATGGTWELPWLLHTIDNSMILEGSISPGTLTAGTTIITLPPFYGPSSDLEFRVGGGSATAYCDLVVHASTGTITITNIAGTITRLSLSTVRWSMIL